MELLYVHEVIAEHLTSLYYKENKVHRAYQVAQVYPVDQVFPVSLFQLRNFELF
jgi:hypothetical protein